MDERPGRQPGAVTPQHSPDGRWWWNGRAWQAASAPVAPHEASRRPIEPGRRLYLVATVAVGAAVVSAVLAATLGGLPDSATARVTAPGTTEIALAEPGTYTISYEHLTAAGVGHDAPSEVRLMQLDLVSTDSNARVPIHSLPGDFSSEEGSMEDVAIDEFSIDHAGTYTLVSRYADGQTGKPVVLAIAAGTTANSGRIILGFLAAAGLLLGGLGLGAVTLILRLRAAWLGRRTPRPVMPDASGPVGPGDTFDPAAIQRVLNGVEAMSLRLPQEARAKVVEIIAEILELLPHANRFPIGSRDLFVLQRTATEYLPTSVNAYLSLPPSYATTVVLRDGKTALGLLSDQLDLLDLEIDEIGDAVRHRDSDRLLVHGRFLEQAFGRGSRELELPRPE